MSLTAKQKMFCAEYLIDLNATQAAIRAGYSKKTAQVIGSQNLAKLIIQQEVQKLMNIRAERAGTTAEDVIKGIIAVIEDAKAMKETDAGRSMTNHTAALKGYELLGKHLAMWTDKKSTKSTIKVSGFSIVGVGNPSPPNARRRRYAVITAHLYSMDGACGGRTSAFQNAQGMEERGYRGVD